MTRALAAAVAGLAVAGAPGVASADLEDDVQRLVGEWKEVGLVERQKPRLLERGSITPLHLPLEWTSPSEPGCTTIVVMGAPTTGLVLRFLRQPNIRRWASGEFPEQSIGGAVQLVRCGARKEMLRRLAIDMRSPRGIVEVLAVRAPRPIPSLRKTLAHRDPGPFEPRATLGPRPKAGPLAARVKRIEDRRARQGAAKVLRRELPSGRDGSGGALVRLEPGCHHIDVLGPEPGRRRRGADVDAELRWTSNDAVVAHDRTESVDASLRVCVGRTRVARLSFFGVPARGSATVVHARWPLASGIPGRWEPVVKGRIADAVSTYHRRPLDGSPVYESLGIGGITVLPIEVEPGACYVAAVAALTGQPSRIALAARAGAATSRNQSETEGAATALGFCSDAADRARIEVDARGLSLAWFLAVWQTGRVPIGATE